MSTEFLVFIAVIGTILYFVRQSSAEDPPTLAELEALRQATVSLKCPECGSQLQRVQKKRRSKLLIIISLLCAAVLLFAGLRYGSPLAFVLMLLALILPHFGRVSHEYLTCIICRKFDRRMD